jgi:Domain of unknown function (DUF4145)
MEPGSREPKKPEHRQAPCTHCGGKWTRQVVQGLVTRSEGHTDWGDPWSEKSYLLECAGCGNASFMRVAWEWGMNPGDETVVVFPQPPGRKKPDWIARLEPQFTNLMAEIYESLAAKGRALPVMGARTIMDLVIQKAVGDQGNFPKGLEALVADGLLSKHDRGILETAIEAGHAAAHRGHIPSEEDVDKVIDIVEHLLNSLFVLKGAAKGLKKTTPKRPRRRKKRLPLALAKPAQS